MSILDLFDSILDLGVYIWASRYRLCPDFGALQFKIGPLRVDFVLSGLKFGPLRFNFGRSGLNFGPLEVIFGPIWLLGFVFQISWIRFYDLRGSIVLILGLGGIIWASRNRLFPDFGLYSSRLDL